MRKSQDILVVAGSIFLMGIGVGACQKAAPEQQGEPAGLEEQAEQTETSAKQETQAQVDTAQVRRGEYLVKHVIGCADCHSPRDAQGQMIPDKFLGGTKGAPNLTPAKGALADWSAQDIKTATFYGKTPGGRVLSPHMPYWMYQAMDDADQDAVASFLKSIPAVAEEADAGAGHDHDAHDHKPAELAEALTVEMMPESTLGPDSEHYAQAQRGKQLAIYAGCTGCHTESAEAPMPLNQEKLLAGGKEFRGMLPSPPFPEVIVGSNLTPDKNGLAGWSPEQVVSALKEGVDNEGQKICPPMPSGPHGTYGEMHDGDALALAHYLTTISAVDNGELAKCVMPEQPTE